MPVFPGRQNVKRKVDLEGFEPSSNSLFSDTLRFLLVNVVMISQNVRFKAVLKPVQRFSRLLQVANPLKL